jgi:ADP-heptose:LPS heptosyltransferase
LKSILAVRRGGLGDLLVILPSLRLLRSVFPEARITLVARPAYGRLFLETGVTDSVEDEDDFRWASLVDPEAPGRFGLSSFPRPEAVVGWFHSKAGAVFHRSASALWPEAEVRSLFADPAEGRPLNRTFFDLTIEYVLSSGRQARAFGECAGLPYLPRVPAGRFAVVHPGSGGRRKIWPFDRFLEIIRFLAGKGYSGAVVTGEVEGFLEARLAEIDLPLDWRRLRSPTISDLALLLSETAIYLGNDSGVTHLAAVLGIPGLAVFRKEFSSVWRPGGKIEVISADDVRDISTEAVQAELLDRGLVLPMDDGA